MLRTTSRKSAPSKFSTTLLPVACTGVPGGSPPPGSWPFTSTPVPLKIRAFSSAVGRPGCAARSAASASAGDIVRVVFSGVARVDVCALSGAVSCAAQAASTSGNARTNAPLKKGRFDIVIFRWFWSSPHACGFATALPPEGELFAPWGGPAALRWTPTVGGRPKGRECAAGVISKRRGFGVSGNGDRHHSSGDRALAQRPPHLSPRQRAPPERRPAERAEQRRWRPALILVPERRLARRARRGGVQPARHPRCWRPAPRYQQLAGQVAGPRRARVVRRAPPAAWSGADW